MIPFSSVAIIEKLALVRIAFCKAPVFSNASWRRPSTMPSALPPSSRRKESVPFANMGAFIIAVDSAAVATGVEVSMAISNGKDCGAYPESIFNYARLQPNHLYANPRKAGVAIAYQWALTSPCRPGQNLKAVRSRAAKTRRRRSTPRGVRSPRSSQTVSRFNTGSRRSFGAIACAEHGIFDFPRALLVNALDEEVALFWRKQGFLASVDDPFIPDRSMSDIAASLSSVGAKT
jgi:hypothetical protein